MTSPLSVLIAEPSPFLREKLAGIIGRQPGVWCVLQVGDLDGMLRGFHEHQPDLILADLSVIADSRVCRSIREQCPAPRIFALLENGSEAYVAAARRAGAHGTIAKAHLNEEIQMLIGSLNGRPTAADAGAD